MNMPTQQSISKLLPSYVLNIESDVVYLYDKKNFHPQNYLFQITKF